MEAQARHLKTLRQILYFIIDHDGTLPMDITVSLCGLNAKMHLANVGKNHSKNM